MPITVPFVEHEESPIESGNRDGDFQFTRIFVTAFDDRWAFVNGIFTGGPLGLPMVYGPGWPAEPSQRSHQRSAVPSINSRWRSKDYHRIQADGANRKRDADHL